MRSLRQEQYIESLKFQHKQMSTEYPEFIRCTFNCCGLMRRQLGETTFKCHICGKRREAWREELSKYRQEEEDKRLQILPDDERQAILEDREEEYSNIPELENFPHSEDSCRAVNLCRGIFLRQYGTTNFLCDECGEKRTIDLSELREEEEEHEWERFIRETRYP